MLARTASGRFWMSRYLECSENTARLVDAGFHLALTRPAEAAPDEWASVLSTSGANEVFCVKYDADQGAHVIDFLLRDTRNPGSVLSMMHQARENARQVRTALTREAFEATNEAWMTLRDLLAKPVSERDLPSALNMIRQQSALVRGAIHGTMLRNDVYNFLRIGTFLSAQTTPPAYWTLSITCCCPPSRMSARRWTMYSGKRFCARRLRIGPIVG